LNEDPPDAIADLAVSNPVSSAWFNPQSAVRMPQSKGSP
jgi:hypothetical protein